MAALSAKVKQGQLVLVDTMVLGRNDALDCVRAVVSQNMSSIKAVDQVNVQKSLFRNLIYRAVGNEPSVFGEVAEGSGGLSMKNVYDDDAVLNNIMQKIEADSDLDPAVLLLKTGMLRYFQLPFSIVGGCRVCKHACQNLHLLSFRAGWFKEHFAKLLPSGWQQLSSQEKAANHLVSLLNV
jgi:hypothetical protein